MPTLAEQILRRFADQDDRGMTGEALLLGMAGQVLVCNLLKGWEFPVIHVAGALIT
jgi:hypothetical protein